MQTVTGGREEGHTSAISSSPSLGSAPSQGGVGGPGGMPRAPGLRAGLLCGSVLPQPCRHHVRMPRHGAPGLSLGCAPAEEAGVVSRVLWETLSAEVLSSAPGSWPSPGQQARDMEPLDAPDAVP